MSRVKKVSPPKLRRAKDDGDVMPSSPAEHPCHKNIINANKSIYHHNRGEAALTLHLHQSSSEELKYAHHKESTYLVEEQAVGPADEKAIEDDASSSDISAAYQTSNLMEANFKPHYGSIDEWDQFAEANRKEMESMCGFKADLDAISQNGKFLRVVFHKPMFEEMDHSSAVEMRHVKPTTDLKPSEVVRLLIGRKYVPDDNVGSAQKDFITKWMPVFHHSLQFDQGAMDSHQKMITLFTHIKSL